MLHQFPIDAPYHEVPALEALSRSEPSEEFEAFERLAKLLPVLEDEVIPVWSTPPFSFQVSSLVSFVDKSGRSLVAIIYESGLLAVTFADTDSKSFKGEEDPWEYLQIPEVWLHRHRIRGLWASPSLRPFDEWTELLVLVAPRHPEAGRENFELYRALVKSTGDKSSGDKSSGGKSSGGKSSGRKIELQSSMLTDPQKSSPWKSVELPKKFEWAGRGQIFSCGGADPFDSDADAALVAQARKQSKAGRMLAFGQTDLAWIDGRDRLVAELDGKAIEISLDAAVEALVCVPSPSDRVRIVMATNRRELEAWELDSRGWDQKWKQPLRHRLLAIDCAASPDLDLATGSVPWPDLLVATNVREIVRFRHVGPDALESHWKREVGHLTSLASVQTGKEWLGWSEELVEECSSADDDDDRTTRRLVHYLALDRLLEDRENIVGAGLHERLGRLYAREKKGPLLLPAFRKLKSLLEEWIEKPEGELIPELVWQCYDGRPFRVQEVIDVCMRKIPQGAHEKLKEVGGEAFSKLLGHSGDVAAFYEPEEALRRAGIHFLRAVDPFMPAGFSADPESEPYRHLVALAAENGPRWFAVSNRGVDCYQLEEKEDAEGSSKKAHIRKLDSEFPLDTTGGKPEVALAIPAQEGRKYLFLGTRGGLLRILDLSGSGAEDFRGAIRWTELEERFESPLSVAVASVAGNTNSERSILLADNPSDGRARLFQIGLSSNGGIEIVRKWSTELRKIRGVAAYTSGDDILVVAGEYGDLVLLRLKKGAQKAEEESRRYLGSTVLDLTLLESEEVPLCICGTRNGLIFAVRLDANLDSWKRLEWVRLFPQGIHRIIPMITESRSRLGVIDAQGHICVLEQDGSISYLRRLYEPAVAMTFVPGASGYPDYLIVAHAESSTLTALRATEGEEQELERARAVIELGARGEGGASRKEADSTSEIGEIGKVIESTIMAREPFAALYRGLEFRTSKRCLAWLLARSPSSEVSKEGLEDVAKDLDITDLATLIRRLSPEARGSLEAQAWLKLRLGDGAENPKKRQWLAALLNDLLWTSRQNERSVTGQLTTIEKKLFENEWIPHLVAGQVLAELDAQGMASGKPEFLDQLMTMLARFPRVVSQAAAVQVSGGSKFVPFEQTLRAWVQLGETVSRDGSKEEEWRTGVRDLRKALDDDWEKENSSFTGFFARYVEFLADQEPLRVERYEKLRDTEETGVASGSLLGWLFQQVSSWSPRAHPDAGSSLKAQEQWIEATRQRIKGLRHRSQEEPPRELEESVKPHKDWVILLGHLLERGRERVAEMIEYEESRLRAKVRLDVKLRDVRRPSKFIAELDLVLTPESLRRVEDLEYRLDFGVSGGLGRLDDALLIENRFELVDPKRRFEEEFFSLRGSTRGDQKEVTAQLELRWRDMQEEGPIRHTVTLSLPEASVRVAASQSPLPDNIPTWTKHLSERIRNQPESSLMILFDKELGRDGFLQHCKGVDTREVDLDVALREVGPGRAYPALLNLGSLQIALQGENVLQKRATEVGLDGIEVTLLVTESDKTWHRLLHDRDLSPILEQLVNLLANLKSRNGKVVFFLGHEIGQQLRRRFHYKLNFFDAHRLPEAEDAESAAIWEEATSWLQTVHEMSSSVMARKALRILGGDLRFASLLRSLVKNRESAEFLADSAQKLLRSSIVEPIVRADLYGLRPHAVQLLMLAGASKTRLRFNQVEQGMVAAEEIYSTPRSFSTSSPKLLLVKGERINSRIIGGLRGDRRYNDRQALVQGFAVQGTVETPKNLRSLANLFSSVQSSRLSKELTVAGIAEQIGALIRTVAPYRYLISEDLKDGRSPTDIYRRLTGGISALEGLSFADLGQLPVEALREIQPELTSAQADMIHALSSAWTAIEAGRTASLADMTRSLRELTGFPVEVLASSSETRDRWRGMLEYERDVLLALRDESNSRHHAYILILTGSQTQGELPRPTLTLLGELHVESDALPDAEAATTKSSDMENREKRAGGGQRQLIVLRPGRENATKKTLRWLELGNEDLKSIILRQESRKVFWGKIRTEMGLMALAPFQKQGALPPGSPIFFGREDEIETIITGIRDKSFLIVGSRQIGKTSLLNEIRFRLRQQSGIKVYHFDLQKGKEVIGRSLKNGETPQGFEDDETEQAFQAMIDRERSRGILPVVLLNEIDDLVMNDLEFLRFLRGFNDSGEARFVMTGYVQAASSSGDTYSPFYHWMSSRRGNPYMVLAELSEEAARKIIGLLKERPLELEWEEGDEEEGVRGLLEHSYRIPHLLQSLCLGLVERLEEKRRFQLRASDVEIVARQPQYSAWQHVRKVDFGQLVPELSGHEKEKASLVVELLLQVAVKRLYFQGQPPPFQTRIRDRAPSSLSLSSDELHAWAREELDGLLRERDFSKIKKVVERINLRALLFNLSLTLILSYDPSQDRHYFQSHLYPIELHRQLERDELIDDRILKQVFRLLIYLDSSESQSAAPTI